MAVEQFKAAGKKRNTSPWSIYPGLGVFSLALDLIFTRDPYFVNMGFPGDTLREALGC